MIECERVPYVDFAIFGPHGCRMERRLRLQAVRFGSGGEIQPIEVFGPSTFDAWRLSYGVFLTAMVMLKAIDLGLLINYGNKVASYVSRFGTAAWPLIYQAESHARSEHMTRLHADALERPDRITSMGVVFDAKAVLDIITIDHIKTLGDEHLVPHA